MRSADFLPASHARVLPALGLSLLLHGALFAGWRPALSSVPRISAFESIEVALVSDRAPSIGATTRTTKPSTAQPVPAADPTLPSESPPTPDTSTGNNEPLVEARSDIASLNNPKPPYPFSARRRGLEGRVLLTAHVDASGACTVVRLKQSSGHGLLDEAALDTVRHWRFVPAMRGARSIESWVDIPVSFRLDS